METVYTDSAIVDFFYNSDGTGLFNTKKYFDMLRSMTPDSTLTINIMHDNIYEMFQMKKEEFKALIKESAMKFIQIQYPTINVRNAFRNMKIDFVSDETIKMHDLNATEHERVIVTFDSEIIAVEREKSYVKECTGVCQSCFTSQKVKCNYDRNLDDLFCNNIRCRHQKLNIEKTGLSTSNLQYMYLQEILSDARNSSPVIIRGVALDEMSGDIYVGQKKRITGMYKSVLDPKKNLNDILIEIISATDLEAKKDNCLTDDDLNMLRLEATKDGFVNKLVSSFAPIIMGYEDIKFSILLMLAGGFSKVKRGDINILLVGDPSLAKSELLKECSKISNKSMYTSGRGASAAGLTIGLVKMDNGTQVAQAGVLPLCNEGHACIDEFDKMNPNDRSSMHEAMEQQTVTIAKAGFRMTLPAKTSILAAANPKYGKYDISMSLTDNIDIPVPLLTRFDLIWLIRDKVNVEEDDKKAKHVLDTFTGDSSFNSIFLNREKLSSYLSHVKDLKPIINDEAKIKLADIYRSMRALSASNESLAVGIRQLEALARLSTAHAKLLFKNTVDISDVLIVEALLKTMFKSLGVTLDKNFNQTTLLIGKKETKEQFANTVWKECEDSNKHVKYSDFMRKLVTDNGIFDDSSAKNLFTKWETACYIKLNGDGTYRKT